TLTVFAGTRVSMLGQISGNGVSSVQEPGGTGGSVSVTAAGGGIALAGVVRLVRTAPAGNGGSVGLDASTGITDAAPIQMPGASFDGCGGSFSANARAGSVTLDDIDVSGGSCGGDVSVDAHDTITVPAPIDADATGLTGTGTVILRAAVVQATSNVHASGTVG